MIGRRKIQVGLAHARKTAEISVEADTYQVTVEPGVTITAPRTTSRDIRRHKALTTPDGDAAERPGPYAFPRSRECRWGLSCRA
jgi:hypothetical protein